MTTNRKTLQGGFIMNQSNSSWMLCLALLPALALAQSPSFNSGSTGALGALNVTGDQVIQPPADGVADDARERHCRDRSAVSTATRIFA